MDVVSWAVHFGQLTCIATAVARRLRATSLKLLLSNRDDMMRRRRRRDVSQEQTAPADPAQLQAL